MEEEEMLSYEAMMDDQNHNNWEAAADNFRQPPPPPPPPPLPPSSSIQDPGREAPGGQLLAVPAGSVDRKGPKEGLPMGAPPLPEPNGVIMMLKSCDTAAAVTKAAPAPSSAININTSTSKFRESGLSPVASVAPPLRLAESPRPGSSSTSFVPGLGLSLSPLPSHPRSVSAAGVWPTSPGCSFTFARSPRLCFRQDLYYAWPSLNISKLVFSRVPFKVSPYKARGEE